MSIKYVFNPFSGKLDAVDVATSSYNGVPFLLEAGDIHETPLKRQEHIAAPVENHGLWVIYGLRVFK